MARPKKYGITIHLRLPEAVIETIDKLRKNKSRSEYMRDIITIHVLLKEPELMDKVGKEFEPILKPMLKPFREALEKMTEEERKKLEKEFGERLKKQVSESKILQDFIKEYISETGYEPKKKSKK